MPSIFDLTGQGILQLEELALAFFLSSLVGLERELRQKAAGLRTNTLVGVSAALFMLISKYGFMDVLGNGRVVVDPSRVAAQIVSGIGFIGGGVIFMRRDAVKGLTTAASVWLTAALGMACGAGLPLLALATTAAHFIIMFAFPKLVVLLPDRRQSANLRLTYLEEETSLQQILVACTASRFVIDFLSVEKSTSLPSSDVSTQLSGSSNNTTIGYSTLILHVKGRQSMGSLIAQLNNMKGIYHVGSKQDDSGLD